MPPRPSSRSIRYGPTAVVCMSAYRKLVGLYDVSVLVASLNRPTQGVQGRRPGRFWANNPVLTG